MVWKAAPTRATKGRCKETENVGWAKGLARAHQKAQALVSALWLLPSGFCLHPSAFILLPSNQPLHLGRVVQRLVASPVLFSVIQQSSDKYHRQKHRDKSTEDIAAAAVVTTATAAARATVTATTRASAVVTTHGSKSFVNRPFGYRSALLASTRPGNGTIPERKRHLSNPSLIK